VSKINYIAAGILNGLSGRGCLGLNNPGRGNTMANRIPPNEFGPNDFVCQTSSVPTNDVATQAAPPRKPVQNAFLKTSSLFK
jgi:hypothetical protein